MSRMSDMAQTIEELRSAAAAISDAVDWLTKVFSSEPQAEDAPASPLEPELTLGVEGQSGALQNFAAGHRGPQLGGAQAGSIAVVVFSTKRLHHLSFLFL